MQEDALTPLLGIILLLGGYLVLIYLKTLVNCLYPSQITPRKKKMDNEIVFFVKNGKYSFVLDQNKLCFKILGILSSTGMMPF